MAKKRREEADLTSSLPDDADQKRRGKADRISSLPDDALSHILSFVSVKQAFRARLLSRRWRHLSPAFPTLRFNPRILFRMAHDSWAWGHEGKFVKAVDRCFQQFRAPKLGSFEVRLCIGNRHVVSVDQWISRVCDMKVEKIDLSFIYNLTDEPYTFPCLLLPAGESSHLKHLRLGLCSFMPSPGFTDRLTSLRTLHLDTVTLTQADFEGILNLVSLTLTSCRLDQIQFLIICVDLLHLELLVLVYCSGLVDVEIHDANLSYLEYSGKPVNFTLHGVSCLETLKVFFFGQSERFLFGLPDDLPRLRSLATGVLSGPAFPV